MNIAVIDDLMKDREITFNHIHEYFSRYCMDMHFTIHAFESGEDFLQVFKENTFDLIFIDYYMDGLSGLDTAFEIRKSDHSAIIIFTTASRDYAIDCYEVQASGYLVKPISFEAFAKILSLVNAREIQEQRFIEIINGYTTVKIPIKDIIYCDISGHYVQIHTVHFGVQRSRMTFTKLNKMLMTYPQFLLCYRGCLINMNHIDHIEELTFLMDSGDRIPFCKKDCNKILASYSQYLFNKVRKQNS